jgi:hypothetical protein
LFSDGRGCFSIHLEDRFDMVDANRRGKEEHRDNAFQMWNFKFAYLKALP